jgi:RND superfamily putative drug exporter
MNQLPGPLRRPRLIVAAWAVIAFALLPFAYRVNATLDASTRLEGSESARVVAALAQKFRSPFTKIALLRLAGTPDPATTQGQAVLARVDAAVRGTPGVQGVMSYLDREDRLFVGRDGSPIIVVGLKVQKGAESTLMASLRATTDTLHTELQAQYPAIEFGWTGEDAVNADMRRLSSDQTRAAELRVLPLTLLILLIAFRSLIAALLPIVCGVLTIWISLGLVALVGRWYPASLIVVSIISMVGLGLSIDYALLIVSRYRDALGTGLSRDASVTQAARYGGRTVVVSGLAVAIGFAALLMVKVSEVRYIGLGGLIVTIVAVLIACTLLPVILAWLGPRIDTGSLRSRSLRAGSSVTQESGRHWRRWATWVTQRPLRVLAVAGIPLLLLAAEGTHLRIDLPRGSWLPDDARSVRVLHEIDSVARGNFGQIIQVILTFPEPTTIHDEAGWDAESHLVRYFAHDPRVQHVWAVTTLGAMPLAGPEILARLPDSVRRSFVSEDGRSVVIQILPRAGLAAADAEGLVRDIRAADPRTMTGLAGVRLDLGGVPGFNVDYERAIRSALVPLVASVVCATLLVLAIAFRSVLIPIKAVALNLLSVAAAFGAVTLVFQHGIGARLVGLDAPMEGGFPILPVLVFCIVFGLSMDYEVFMVARIADGRRNGLSDAEALVESLAGTGRVITFAAAIMVMVFAGFVFGDFILIKILGFALSVAVLLDATVIRLAVGPALVRLAGRWNWWPGRRPER